MLNHVKMVMWLLGIDERKKHAEAEGEKLGITAEGEQGRWRKGIKADTATNQEEEEWKSLSVNKKEVFHSVVEFL